MPLKDYELYVHKTTTWYGCIIQEVPISVQFLSHKDLDKTFDEAKTWVPILGFMNNEVEQRYVEVSKAL